jgi:hypothetical protein
MRASETGAALFEKAVLAPIYSFSPRHAIEVEEAK